MNVYLAVLWKKEAHSRLDQEVFLPYLLRKPDRVESWGSKRGQVDILSFAYWPDFVLPKTHLIAKEAQAVCFDGFPDAGIDTATATPESFSTQLLEAAKKDIRSIQGEFSILYSENESLAVYLNPNGSHPVYYVDQPDFVAFSNRLPLLLQLPGISHELNPRGAQWLCYQGFTQCNDTCFKAVRKLTSGDLATVNSRGDLSIRPTAYSDVVCKKYADFSPKKLPAIFEDHCGEMVQYVKRMHSFYTRLGIMFRLSGGKDSRTALPMLLHAGLKEAIKDCYTSGPYFAPDVISAQHITSKIGLKTHRIVREPAVKDTMTLNTNSLLESLNVTAGQLSIHDFCRVPGPAQHILVTGHQGLRDAWFRHCPSGSIKQFGDAMFNTYFHDPLHLLGEKARPAFMNDYLEMFHDFHRKEKAPLDAVAEIHAYREVQGAWGAAIHAATYHSAPMCSPLLHPGVLSLTMAMPKRYRCNEMYHFMCVATLAPELLDVPFNNQQWFYELGDILKGVINVPDVTPYQSSPHFPVLSNMFLPPEKITYYNTLKPHMAELAEKHAALLEPHLSMEHIRKAMKVNPSIQAPELVCGLGLYTYLFLAEYGLDLFHQDKLPGIIDEMNTVFKERVITADPGESREKRYDAVIEKYEKSIAGFVRELQTLKPSPKLNPAVTKPENPWRHIHIRNNNPNAAEFYLVLAKTWGRKHETQKLPIKCGDTFSWGVRVEPDTQITVCCDAIQFQHPLTIDATIMAYHVEVN